MMPGSYSSVSGSSCYHEYKPLLPRTFRVIRLQPSNTYTSQVEATIKVLSLDDDVPFDALSYTWGPSTLDEEDEQRAQIFTRVERCYTLILDGRIVRITRSLRDALRRMRLGIYSSGSIEFRHTGLPSYLDLLFADGVCIDQENLDERALQVSLMGTIFGKARTVRAYIGAEDETVRPALEVSERLLNFGGQKQELSKALTGGSPSASDPRIYTDPSKVYKLATIYQWRDWTILLSRAWFWRSWVMQEVARSSETVLSCGEIDSKFPNLAWGTRVLELPSWISAIRSAVQTSFQQDLRWAKYADAVSAWLAKGHVIGFLLTAHVRTIRKESSQSFARMGPLMEKTKCSDPRDKIFSMMGIASEFRFDSQSPFQVDYTLGVNDTFLRATRHILLKSRCLDVLRLIQHNHRTSSLPSWCPDYNSSATSDDLHDLYVKADGLSDCSASSDSEYTPEAFPIAANELAVRAIRLGRIISCVEASAAISLRNSAEILQFLNLNMGQDLQQNEIKINAFWRTLGTSLLKVGISEDPHAFEDVTRNRFQGVWTGALLRQLSKCDINRSTMSDIFRVCAAVRAINSVCPPANGILPDVLSLERELHRVLQGVAPCADTAHSSINLIVYWPILGTPVHDRSVERQIFATDQNGFGVGIIGPKPGDEVWLLAGGKIAYVLRDCNDGTYEYVSGAHYEGAMNGEYWPADESMLESIHLV